MTTGLITGETSIKITAAGRGTPFFTRLLKMGMDAQSQTGRQKPARMANNCPDSTFLGNFCCIQSGGR